jgi:hypothetical protein
MLSTLCSESKWSPNSAQNEAPDTRIRGLYIKEGMGWSGRPDSNRRPFAWEANALPTELLPLGLNLRRDYIWISVTRTALDCPESHRALTVARGARRSTLLSRESWEEKGHERRFSRSS